MPASPFPPRPVPPRQDDPHGVRRVPPRPPPNTPVRPLNDASRTPRGILRPIPLSYLSTPHHPTVNVNPPGHPPPIPRSTTTTSPYHHHHTSSSPELPPSVDAALAPRVRAYPPQHPDRPQAQNAFTAVRPRPDQDDGTRRWSGFAARVTAHFVPGIRGRSASDVRIAPTPPPDLDPDRLARACGQPPLASLSDRARQDDSPSSRVKDTGTVRYSDPAPSHPPLPKARVGHLYRRLDTLARRSGRRAMDHLSFEDVAVAHTRDNQLREQLRRKQSERLQEKDPSFHAIGAPLADVLMYASTHIVVGEYQYHLPIVVVACVEELTKTGIYQSGLFRALPSRDRHLQLIDLYDKSPDFGAHFNMRGQAMPDICALLSTFISSLPTPLLDAQIYSALWHWSVKPTVKREDARRDRQEEDEEERRARGEPPRLDAWMTHNNDLYLDDSNSALENDQISIAQILLRFLPSANLSLLAYLCGFFTQLPLCPENGLQLEDVARIFGHRLLGGSVKMVSQKMMMWLLARWHRISETLFGGMCGVTPPSTPLCASHSRGSAAGESSSERIETRKGKRASGTDDVLHHTMSSSSAHSSSSTESPENRGPSSRKSSSDGEEVEGETSGGRQRKKRELDVQEPRHDAQAKRSSTIAGHGRARRSSGSRRHHHGHSSEQKNAPTSPDPFAMAFAKAQQDLSDAPLLTNPSSAVVRGEEGGGSTESRSHIETANVQRVDTSGRITRYDNESRRTDVDIRVVDALLQETVVATDAARALAERVQVLEKALQVRRGKEDLVERPDVRHRPGDEHEDAHGANGEDGNRDADKDTEDGLRLQLRLVEAERDKAQRIVRDMRAYLLDDEGPTMQRRL